ncbi:hypothetical protein JW930_01745 [Candidatus Woesearchaeota archaeon]|nr:hypothetical protein [Candidatus Woesearchaeota archaeon]
MEEDKKRDKFFSKFLNYFNVFKRFIDYLAEHSDTEIQKIKGSVVRHIVIYSLLVISTLFLVTGTIKYLAELYSFSEGLGFIIVGGVLLIVLLFHLLIEKI